LGNRVSEELIAQLPDYPITRLPDYPITLPDYPMQIARVVGTVVSTQKHEKFEGAKLLLVQPLNVDDTPRGTALLAVDGVGAGVQEKVLIVLEGRAAGEALGKKGAPVDAAVIGIIDMVNVSE